MVVNPPNFKIRLCQLKENKNSKIDILEFYGVTFFSLLASGSDSSMMTEFFPQQKTTSMVNQTKRVESKRY